MNAPPLLTARPVGGTTQTVLFGGNLNDNFRNGFQLRGGFWLNDCGTCGLEAGMLFLGGLAQRTSVGDTTGTVIGRPFFNAVTNMPDEQLISVPGTLSGRSGQLRLVQLLGGGCGLPQDDLLCAADCNSGGRLDAVLGYRFLSYGDSVSVTEDLSPLTAPFPSGTRIGVSDSFTAQNQFHGMLFRAPTGPVTANSRVKPGLLLTRPNRRRFEEPTKEKKNELT